MNQFEDLLRHYDANHYTVTGFMLEVLQLITEDNVEMILSALPVEVGIQLRKFVGYYHPGIRVFHAPKPSMEVIGLVKQWLSENPLFREESEAQE